MSKKLIIVCLVNFLIAALLGLTLRFSYVQDIGINYRFLTHAHSHVAMLGWVYLMLYTLFVHYFTKHNKSFYNKLFWVTEIAVIGMLLSFPFQGYATISITFSTLHIFCSYFFAYRIWKDLYIKNHLIAFMVKTALTFMLLSTIGIWCLGPAVGLMGKASAFYQIAIQFFLHFQFNGWFLMGVLAILFHELKIEPSKITNRLVTVIIIATILTLALPVQWFTGITMLYFLNATGIILQIWALILFLKAIKNPYRVILANESSTVKWMYYFALSCFILKLVLQGITLFPGFSETLINHTNFIIGFIHLTMLGTISGFLLAFILKAKDLETNKITSLGVYLFLIGFVLTEFLLTLQGSYFYFQIGFIKNYYLIIFTASIFLPLGITFIIYSFFKNKNACLLNR